MATLKSLAAAVPVLHCSSPPNALSVSGISSYRIAVPSLKQQCVRAPHSPRRWHANSWAAGATAKPSIQFIQGTDELTIPEVKLTKSRDGTNGMATFCFEEPSVFDSSRELGDITGFYMIDEEGVLQSVDVSAKFVNGKPARIEAKHVMRTPQDWDRFMRFMERYADANGLAFFKS